MFGRERERERGGKIDPVTEKPSDRSSFGLKGITMSGREGSERMKAGDIRRCACVLYSLCLTQGKRRG